MRFKEVNGYQIEYVDSETKGKSALVFVHGLGGNVHQWDEQYEYFEDNYRVIGFSLQGHGDSQRGEDKSMYSMTSYAKIAIALLKELEVKECIWVGNSMGGVVGFEVLKQEPSLISRLITNGTAPRIQYSKSALKMVKFTDRFLMKLLGYSKYLDIAVNACIKEKEGREKLKSLFLKADPFTIISSHQELGSYDYLSVMKETNRPITIISTPNDKDINKAIKSVNGELTSLKHVHVLKKEIGGHVVNVELSATYNAWLEEVLNGEKR